MVKHRMEYGISWTESSVWMPNGIMCVCVCVCVCACVHIYVCVCVYIYVPVQWTWTWANSGRWWGTGKPSMPQSMGSQRVRHNLATEQQQKRESITGMWKNMDKALTGVSMGSWHGWKMSVNGMKKVRKPSSYEILQTLLKFSSLSWEQRKTMKKF